MGIVLLPAGFGFLILGLAGEADHISLSGASGFLSDLSAIGVGLALWTSIPFLAKIVLGQLRSIRELQAQADSYSRIPPVAARYFVFGAFPLALFSYACRINEDFYGLEPFALAGSLGASIACAYLWSRRV